MTARSFTFASLLLAAASPAFAEPPSDLSKVLAEAEPAAPLPLSAKWDLKVKNGVLIAELKLVNTSASAVDIVVARGHSLGPSVQASLDDVALNQLLEPAQERDMMSRMGPMPSYGPVAAGGERTIGTYRFELPADSAGKTLRLDTWVRGQAGSVRLLMTMPLDPRGQV